MDDKDKVFIDNRLFRTLLKLKKFLAWTPGGDRESKHKKSPDATRPTFSPDEEKSGP